MAKLLNDIQIKKIIGAVIVNGEDSLIRPNAYLLRLGQDGEFLDSEKRFKLGWDAADKKGVRIQPGHSVAITAYEDIDFREKTVLKFFPNCGLYGLVFPTTDISREGLVINASQIDTGYCGTLNWTLTNTSTEIRDLMYKEPIFQLQIYMLEKEEIPERLYDGAYQEKLGYVRSLRKAPPVGIKVIDMAESGISVDSFGTKKPLKSSNIFSEKVNKVTEKKLYVFISYSHEDSSIALNISDILSSKGIEHFHDSKDIRWGSKITDSVESALRKSTHQIIVLSPASIKSGWVNYEVGYADGAEKVLLPYLTHPSLEVPGYLSNRLHVSNISEIKEYFAKDKRTPNIEKGG